ncbi:MAG: radical SAM protein [Armatimonadota bacterium]|nr:radical SAM protein [Armatimonadota bacterium]
MDPVQQPMPQTEATRPASVVVHEVPCRSVLNRWGGGGYSLNGYTGCTHACVYCYARFMQRFHPHPEPWGQFVDVKSNAPEVLSRQLRRTPPGPVFVSSACDAWQPLEREWEITRRCCEVLFRYGFAVHALTKSSLVLRDLDLFAGRDAQVGVTLTTLDERLRRLWEPNAAPVAERLRVLREAKAAGIRTAVMFGPLLPFLSDGPHSLDALFAAAMELQVDVVWVDALNPRPRVWESIAALLRRRFPELVPRYGEILFNREAREAYLHTLRQRVSQAAQRHRLGDRLRGCP